MMSKEGTLEVLQSAAAHLLLSAETASDDHAEEMRSIAAQIQALIVSPYFVPQPSKAVPELGR